ncbi:MAG: hypothetical protein DRR06_03775 [Gammaproteobacteria bacterium]|nr:MAG: hypothetical protein DRR06_03775 [Gammaproteobacteria bacterium]RLA50631.1 MAG: hypothetical protein DRR42_12600 [Gammaproteobacteria bacterium]
MDLSVVGSLLAVCWQSCDNKLLLLCATLEVDSPLGLRFKHYFCAINPARYRLGAKSYRLKALRYNCAL